MSNGRQSPPSTDPSQPLMSAPASSQRSRTANIPATTAKVFGPVGVATRTGVGLGTPVPSAPSTAMRAIGGVGDAAVGIAATANVVSAVQSARKGETVKALGSGTTALGQFGASASGVASRIDPAWAAANKLGQWSAGFTAFAGAATAFSSGAKIWNNRSSGKWTWSDLGRFASGAAIATGAGAMAAGFTATAFPAVVAGGAGLGLLSGASDWWHGEPVASAQHDVESPALPTSLQVSPGPARSRSFSDLSAQTSPMLSPRSRADSFPEPPSRHGSTSPQVRSRSGSFSELV